VVLDGLPRAGSGERTKLGQGVCGHLRHGGMPILQGANQRLDDGLTRERSQNLRRDGAEMCILVPLQDVDKQRDAFGVSQVAEGADGRASSPCSR